MADESSKEQSTIEQRPQRSSGSRNYRPLADPDEPPTIEDVIRSGRTYQEAQGIVANERQKYMKAMQAGRDLCTCNAMQVPHVHDEGGIHGPETKI